MRSEPKNFVVQIESPESSPAEKGTTPLIGRVESLESGGSTRFRSARVLLRFIREATAESPSQPVDGRDHGDET